MSRKPQREQIGSSPFSGENSGNDVDIKRKIREMTDPSGQINKTKDEMDSLEERIKNYNNPNRKEEKRQLVEKRKFLDSLKSFNKKQRSNYEQAAQDAAENSSWNPKNKFKNQ